ncbi:dual specificity protein phosphatase family protein [Psychromonas algicola]|uniref:dual specificity protein phosphatase family protein n=1 Tax=Psychromonas algicola TaxID=2555642 RepID=UPI001068D14B|nr:dual specificity protein phosphatase family protein [Psychromonas sp. RZ5]TEW51548.1 phosphatase PAP2 family protein [Psychromonas sp. RZ5]
MDKQSAYLSQFDASLDAPATLKERFVWLVFMGIVFFLLYGAANQFAANTAPHFSFLFDWENNIPFIPGFIVPYMSSDIVFVFAFLLVQTRLALRILAVRVLFIVLVSVSIFILLPLQFSYDKPAIDSFNFLFKLLEADKPFNQLPSLHVSFSIVFWFCMKQHIPNKWIKASLGIWLLLIIISTLFVYQHHFIDLPTGLLVGFLAVYLFNKKSKNSILNQFMTPRHLKMGLYFLAASIALMILSFSIHPLFMYLFITTFSVSLVYAFGMNNLLVSTKKKPNLVQWIVFFPYFLGTRLSWHFYKRSLPLMAKVDDGFYIGRFPTLDEYDEISELGIKRVVNLAIELQLNQTTLKQDQFNFLDQTIQDPALLHQAVLLVKKHKSQGVYVHCALGLSRSILVASAWMLYSGKTEQEIALHLKTIRPRYIQSKYMQVNINLYKSYLKTLK